jgi:hypothetical protein
VICSAGFHSTKIAHTAPPEFTADLAAISSDIHDVFVQNRMAGLNARQSVLAIGAR